MKIYRVYPAHEPGPMEGRRLCVIVFARSKEEAVDMVLNNFPNTDEDNWLEPTETN